MFSNVVPRSCSNASYNKQQLCYISCMHGSFDVLVTCFYICSLLVQQKHLRLQDGFAFTWINHNLKNKFNRIFYEYSWRQWIRMLLSFSTKWLNVILHCRQYFTRKCFLPPRQKEQLLSCHNTNIVVFHHDTNIDVYLQPWSRGHLHLVSVICPVGIFEVFV